MKITVKFKHTTGHSNVWVINRVNLSLPTEEGILDMPAAFYRAHGAFCIDEYWMVIIKVGKCFLIHAYDLQIPCAARDSQGNYIVASSPEKLVKKIRKKVSNYLFGYRIYMRAENIIANYRRPTDIRLGVLHHFFYVRTNQGNFEPSDGARSLVYGFRKEHTTTWEREMDNS